MNEIIFFHSPRNPISSIFELEEFVSGVCPLEDIKSIIILTTDNDLSISKGTKTFSINFRARAISSRSISQIWRMTGREELRLFGQIHWKKF